MANFTPKVKVDGAILAGGLGTRMGGLDKGLQSYNGEVMVKTISQVLRPYTRNLLINCNRNHERYAQYADALCQDQIEGFKGPLAGLHSLLKTSDAEYLLVCPCDTPLIEESYCQKMLALLERKDRKVPLLAAVKTNSKHHPLHLLIHYSYQNALEKSVQEGRFKVMLWLEEQGVEWIEFPDQEIQFSNFNRLQPIAE